MISFSVALSHNDFGISKFSMNGVTNTNKSYKTCNDVSCY